MTSRIIFFSLSYMFSQLVFGLGVSPIYADEEFTPFVAESTGGQVNVRAGQSSNFEQLCQLDKGEEVVVIDKEFSWFKIQLPLSAKSYVSKDYVKYLGQNAGGVTANQVNIRAGPGIHNTVIGQLSKGEQIYILEEFEQWHRIEPIAECYGWVSEKYLKFKSKDTSELLTTRIPKVLIEEKIQTQELVAEEESGEEAVQEIVKITIEDTDSVDDYVELPQNDEVEDVHYGKKAVQNPVKVVKRGIISVVGYVEPHEDSEGDGVYYKIVSNGKPACFVQGVNHMLGRFVHHQVTVDGTVNQKLQDRYPSPVISVVKVRLML